MNRFSKILQNYLILAFPAVLVIMVWGTIDSSEPKSPFLAHALWELLGWNIMLWFVALIVFLGTLVLFPPARERTLTRLANVKERDEREQYITGRAARTSYISTMSVLILCLFFSIFSVTIKKKIGEEKGSVRIGLSFSLLEKDKNPSREEGVVFQSSDIPISKSALLLSVLTWQILSFSIPARRWSHTDETA